MRAGALADLVRRQPQDAQDAVVQRASRFLRPELAGEREADVGHAFGFVARHGARDVDAEQRGRPERMRGLLDRLARRGLDQRLAGIEVAGRLVQAHAVRGLFLDHQEAAVALDDGRDGDARFPGAGHDGEQGSARAG